MAEDSDVLEAKVERLTRQIEELSQRLDYLYSYLGIPDRETTSLRRPEDSQGSSREEGIINWAAKASLLPGVSTVCFLLVVALILRTLTDSNVLDTKVGSFIGMGYAGVLMLAGYWRYKKQGTLGSVFSVCGAVLLCSVVVESYQRFHSLPSLGAYAVLVAVGLWTSVMGERFKKEVLTGVGLLGMCAAGVILEYPAPFFPYLAGFLFLANILGFKLRKSKGFSWIRWAVLLITLSVMTYWSGGLTIALGRQGQEIPASLAFFWFLPFLGSFSLLYPAICLLGTVGENSAGVPRFEAIVPGLTGLWAFGAAYQVVESWGRSAWFLGLTGGALGLAYLVAAHWLGRLARTDSRGTNSFAFGACLLMAASLPFLTGSGSVALAFLSGIAFGLFVLSGIWRSGAVRLTSYLLQVYTATGTAFFLWGEAQSPPLAVQILLGGLVSFTGALHYAWCIKSPPSRDSSVFFSRYDKKDRSSVLTLAGSVLSGFFVLRAAMKEAIYVLPGDPQNSFLCSQSLLLNLAASVLMFFAYFRADQAARNLAILITLMGAVKVFMIDLLQARGFPLVLSVFSLGVAVLLESILLGRWQKGAGAPDRGSFSKTQDSHG